MTKTGMYKLMTILISFTERICHKPTCENRSNDSRMLGSDESLNARCFGLASVRVSMPPTVRLADGVSVFEV